MFNLGVIVVIDSSNRNQISSVKGKLVRLLSNKCLRDVPLLIYAHKQVNFGQFSILSFNSFIISFYLRICLNL